MIGNPLYDVLPEHVLALVTIALLPVVAWLVRATAGPSGVRREIVASYARLRATERLAVWLLLVSAASHVGLALAHDGGIRVVFLVQVLAVAWVVRRLLAGRPWRRWGGFLMAGSIAAWWVSSLAGSAPDQVAMLVKLDEIAALAVIALSGNVGKARGVAAVALLIVVVVVTDAAAWVGSFGASASTARGGDGVALDGDGHHDGATAPPGTTLPAPFDRPPTAAESAAAAAMVRATAAAIAPYADPATAAAAGFRVEEMFGRDFHAENPANENDGRVFDPEHPESLVYAVSDDGRPVLLGAVFTMPHFGQSGPAPGGPLTVWHGHEHVCVGLTPPGLTGLLSPLGGCPVGSVDIPRTPEMIHLWIVPGVEDPFGHLDDATLDAYLQTTSGRRDDTEG